MSPDKSQPLAVRDASAETFSLRPEDDPQTHFSQLQAWQEFLLSRAEDRGFGIKALLKAPIAVNTNNLSWLIAASREAPSGTSVVHPLRDVIGPTTDVETLRRENERLRSQVEILKSRVAQEQRSSSREVQRFDQLDAKHHALMDKLIGQLNERANANDALQQVLIAKTDQRLRMYERHAAIVVDSDEYSATLRFQIADEYYEHTYRADQFVNARPPAVGAELQLHVFLSQLLPTAQCVTETEAENEPARNRKYVKPPREF